jgi:hypothetical protein
VGPEPVWTMRSKEKSPACARNAIQSVYLSQLSTVSDITSPAKQGDRLLLQHSVRSVSIVCSEMHLCRMPSSGMWRRESLKSYRCISCTSTVDVNGRNWSETKGRSRNIDEAYRASVMNVRAGVTCQWHNVCGPCGYCTVFLSLSLSHAFNSSVFTLPLLLLFLYL